MRFTCFQSTATWCKIYHHFRQKIGYLDLNQNSTGKNSGERYNTVFFYWSKRLWSVI